MFKKPTIIVFLVATLLFIAACGEPADPNDQVVPDEPDEITLPDALPEEVQEWIDGAREEFAAQTMEYEDVLYLLVTYGEKPTGGYDVEITSIVEEADKLVVTVDFTEPGEDDIVTQALTYPYDLAMLDDPGLPVEFVATGAETEVPLK